MEHMLVSEYVLLTAISIVRDRPVDVAARARSRSRRFERQQLLIMPGTEDVV
jgi:hypothetical protein